jgi:hypothetical protein
MGYEVIRVPLHQSGRASGKSEDFLTEASSCTWQWPLRGSVRPPGWLNLKQPVVEQRNLAPVRRCCGGTLGVNSGNGRLQSVGTEAAGLQGFPQQCHSLRDLLPVLQQNQLSGRRGSRGE